MLPERNMMERKTNATTQASSSHTEKPRRNSYPPTSMITLYPSSHFPRSCTPGKHYFPLSNSSLLWCAILLLWYCPMNMVNGLPLVMTSKSNLGLDQDVNLDSSLILPGRSFGNPEQLWNWYLQNMNNMLNQEVEPEEEDDDDTSNIQEATGSDERDNMELATRMHQRQKKGLSYLTKYYSEAFLNNTPNSSRGVSSRSGGNPTAKSLHDSNIGSFFGVSTGSSSASGELRFPSSVRRKLSFYPAMTSHSVYITPWSRVSSGGGASGGRHPTMRLRWGK